MAMAAFGPVTGITFNNIPGTPPQYMLQSITAGGNTYVLNTLAYGATVGSPSGGSIASIDDFNLNSVSTGNGSWTKTVLFGGANFTDSNGSLPDFFLFEASPNITTGPDDVSIAAIFPDDSLGMAVVCPTDVTPTGWGYTGYRTGGGTPVNNDQFINGLAWDITDLKDAAGNFLPAGSTIKGIQILPGSSIDPCGFYAVVPAPAIDHFSVVASSPQLAGVAFDVTITAQDASNATVNDSTTVVTASGSQMEFDWNSDGIYGDKSGTLEAGVKMIKARTMKAQTMNIVASAGTGGSITTTSPPDVLVTPDAFAMLQILAPGEVAAPGTATGKTGTPSAQIRTLAFNVTVNAVDQYWNLSNTATDLVGITSTDGAAILPSDANLVAGTGIFAVTLGTVGTSSTLTATDLEPFTTISSNTTPAITVQEFVLVWQGNGSDNLWDTSTPNWKVAGTPRTYADGNIALFNDTSANQVVDIVGTLSPGSVTVNSTGNFTLGSSSGGLIDGSTSLTKSGTGTLTLATENTYTGGTFVNGGTLSVNTIDDTGASALGNSGTLTLGGGKLSYTGSSAATTARAVSVFNSTIELTNGNLTLNGAVTYTANTTLTKTGGGTLTLGGTVDNSYLLLNATAGEVKLGKTSSGAVHAVAGISGIANGATVKLTGTGGDQIYDGTAPYGVNGLVAGGTLNLNGNSETIGVLNGTGGVVDGGSGTPTLTLGNSNNGSSIFGGVIQNSGGTLSLIKIGTSALTLAGANT